MANESSILVSSVLGKSSHKWRSTLKSAVFGVSSLLPPLVGGGGGLVCESIGKADLLSDHFDAHFGVLFCSVVLGCCYIPQLLDWVVNGACFLTGGVYDCDLAHRRSVVVLCMLYKIECNPMHQLCGALPVPYVPVRVTCGAFVAHRYTYAPPRCRSS